MNEPAPINYSVEKFKMLLNLISTESLFVRLLAAESGIGQERADELYRQAVTLSKRDILRYRENCGDL